MDFLFTVRVSPFLFVVVVGTLERDETGKQTVVLPVRELEEFLAKTRLNECGFI